MIEKESFVRINKYKEFKKDFNYNDPNYAFYYKFIKRPISYPLTWLVYKKTQLRPNTLSYMGFFLAFLSALFFLEGSRVSLVIGALLFFAYDIFDDFDGIIARSKNIRSRRGGWLDILAGCIGKMIVVGAVAIGSFANTGDITNLVLGIISVIGMAAINNIDHVTKIRYSVVVQQKMKFVETKPDPKTLAGKLSMLSEILFNVWLLLIILAGIFDMVNVFLMYSAAYYTIYPITLFFYLNRKYKNV